MENFKKSLANVIVESLEQDFLGMKYKLDLDSSNYLGMMKSDVINTNLIKVFTSDRYVVHKFKRRAWEGRFVLDIESKSLVIITSIPNLNKIPAVKDRKVPHYMQTVLWYLNDAVTAKKQISFNPMFSFDSRVYEDDFANIFGQLDIDLDDYTYYVVAYDFNSNKVTDMNWYLLGTEFNVAEKTSMMDLVNPDFINLTNSDVESHEELLEEEEKDEPKKGIKLGLKQKVMKKKDNGSLGYGF